MVEGSNGNKNWESETGIWVTTGAAILGTENKNGETEAEWEMGKGNELEDEGRMKLENDWMFIGNLLKLEEGNCWVETSDGRFLFCWVYVKALLYLPATSSTTENPDRLFLV